MRTKCATGVLIMAGRNPIGDGGGRVNTNMTLDRSLKESVVKKLPRRNLSELVNTLLSEWLHQRRLEDAADKMADQEQAAEIKRLKKLVKEHNIEAKR